MTDFLTPTERSERMSRIKGTNIRTEVILRKANHSFCVRYRLFEKTIELENILLQYTNIYLPSNSLPIAINYHAYAGHTN